MGIWHPRPQLIDNGSVGVKLEGVDLDTSHADALAAARRAVPGGHLYVVSNNGEWFAGVCTDLKRAWVRCVIHCQGFRSYGVYALTEEEHAQSLPD